jgi:hypothetical protein
MAPAISNATPVIPAYDADSPTPTVLTGFSFEDGSPPFTIPLTGVAGDLVVEGIVTYGPSAQVVLIPEPASLVLLGLGGLALLVRRR